MCASPGGVKPVEFLNWLHTWWRTHT